MDSRLIINAKYDKFNLFMYRAKPCQQNKHRMKSNFKSTDYVGKQTGNTVVNFTLIEEE